NAATRDFDDDSSPKMRKLEGAARIDRVEEVLYRRLVGRMGFDDAGEDIGDSKESPGKRVFRRRANHAVNDDLGSRPPDLEDRESGHTRAWVDSEDSGHRSGARSGGTLRWAQADVKPPCRLRRCRSLPRRSERPRALQAPR